MVNLTSRRIMLQVCGALIPGAAVMIWFFGWGVLSNLLICASSCLVVEAFCLRVMGRSISPTLVDGSSLLTGLLIGLAFPPSMPWYVLFTGALGSVGLGKYIYGGLGNNPFNPAMVGYAIVLISFPAQLSLWPSPVDGTTGATALDLLSHRSGQTVADLWQANPLFGRLGGYGFEWMNLGFLIGGAYLLARRLIQWRIVIAVLGSIGIAAAIGYDEGSSVSHGSPLYHWFSGSTMIGAFFIATDPVTHPANKKGQWIFGILVGLLIYGIRAFGSYPDGLVFAILLANCCSPWLDQRLSPHHA